MLKGVPDPFEHIEICEKMSVDWVWVQNEITRYVYISMGIKWDEPQDLNNTLKFPIGLPVFN